MTIWRRRETRVVTGLALLLVGVLAVAGLASAQDSPNIPVNATATPLTSLSNLSVVSVQITGTGGDSLIYGTEIRQCKGGVSVINDFFFDPANGRCIAAPFSTDTNYKSVNSDPGSSNTALNTTFTVGTGTQVAAPENGNSTITCGAGSPCQLVLRMSVPVSATSNGTKFKSFTLDFGGAGTTTTSTTSTSTSSTSTTSTTLPTTTTSTTSTTLPTTTTSTTSTTLPTTTTSTTSTTLPTTTTSTTSTTLPTTTTSTTSTTLPTTTTSTTSTTLPTTTTSTTSTTLPTTTTSTTLPTTTTSTTSTTLPTTTTTTGGTTTTTTGGGTTTTTVPSGPTLTLSTSSVAVGGTFTLTSEGWAPNAEVAGVVNSDPVSLGTFVADAAGKIVKTVTLPASVPAGSHTVTLTGLTPGSSTATSVSAALAVSAASASTTTSSTPTALPATPTTTGTLPLTGTDTYRLVITAFLLLAVGCATLLVARVRTAGKAD